MDRQANKNKSNLGVFSCRLEVLLVTACMRETRTQPQDHLAFACFEVKANHVGGSALAGCTWPGAKYTGQ